MTALRLCLFLFSAALAVAQPVVFTANTILDDLVRQVAGPDATVRCLIAPGVDPHTYDPKPAQIRTVAQASLVIVNGLGFEPWADKLIRNSGFTGRVLVASDGCPHLPLSGPPPVRIDPHAWHDPRNAAHYVANITEALVAVAPSREAAFRERAARLTAELAAAHAYARAQFASLPPARRKLVTSHDALRYLGHAYGLELVPVAGFSPDQEPNARQLAAVVRFIRDQQVRAVFVETTSNPKVLGLIAAEAGVKVTTELLTDSLDLPGTPGDTYIGMFRRNVDTIVAALR